MVLHARFSDAYASSGPHLRSLPIISKNILCNSKPAVSLVFLVPKNGKPDSKFIADALLHEGIKFRVRGAREELCTTLAALSYSSPGVPGP